MLKKIIFLLAIFSISALKAQVSIADSSIKMLNMNVTYSGLLPAGDMSKRFGYASTLGVDFSYKLANNFYFSAGLNYLFGNKVKEDTILKNILTDNGQLIGNNGSYLDVRFQEAGFIVPFTVGKIFPIKGMSPNKNSGIYVELGGQFIQHKIAIQTARSRVYAVNNVYKKGYDRLTNGLGAKEAIGYRFYDSKGFYNFDVGFVFSQNFTQNRREVNLDTGLKDTKKRVDLLQGFRVSWIYPIYKRAPEKFYYH
jgi:hypothetical protein